MLLSKRFSNIFFASGDGRAGGSSLCWNDCNINLNLIAHNSRFVHCDILDRQFNTNFLCTFVYVYPKNTYNLNCGAIFLI